MHTVAETEAYLATARRAGMTAREMESAVAIVAANPAAGDLIVGSGGCRKLRLAGRGKGKSGGYRIVTYYWSENSPVYLIAALPRDRRAISSRLRWRRWRKPPSGSPRL